MNTKSVIIVRLHKGSLIFGNSTDQTCLDGLRLSQLKSGRWRIAQVGYLLEIENDLVSFVYFFV